MTQPIFLTPVFQERIWGGTRLRDAYNYDIPSNTTGECWAISAHPNGQSIVTNGEYDGSTLSELWDNHRELFGHREGDRFPLLTKVLDANDDLSVQVHPGDQYAKEFENGELGKTECWYIIDCDDDAEVIFGHNARSKEELVKMSEDGKWNELLQRVKIKPGDFFYVPSGSIHALCKGTLVLETQQSSDTTYRVYDYDRRDQDGNLRELHLEKAIEVTTIPHTVSKVEPKISKMETSTITTFVEEQYFTVYKWDVHSRLEMTQDKPFMLVSVIEGTGELTVNDESYLINKGEHFILPSSMGDFVVDGNMQLIVSHP
ncbi:mannose-6-phosphate isomerase, class I [Metabacillus rhizolycopersici]|uniref:Mannose-6-phosphate isomerase n=1 Tax=Metabacillus rhizolycopersici TaxID=2875709 RepID=A0ABS7UM91_9BACI|nr:mannose-6-phosphate isomerase, class I [Metabacillus rhizolycopersici]MBZ5749050.1 mannose-6-phosphate isomerase, class I [Metabacillus rhizolycopersici]